MTTPTLVPTLNQVIHDGSKPDHLIAIEGQAGAGKSYLNTPVDDDYLEAFGPVQEVHPDFTAVPTPWGTQYLHKDKKVWFAYYPLAKHFALVGKGYWQAYHGNMADKPWTEPNWAIGRPVKTKEETAAACLEFLRD